MTDMNYFDSKDARSMLHDRDKGMFSTAIKGNLVQFSRSMIPSPGRNYSTSRMKEARLLMDKAQKQRLELKYERGDIIRSCSQCGHEGSGILMKIEGAGSYRDDFNNWVMKCPNCQIPIPTAGLKGQAKAHWNRLHNPDERGEYNRQKKLVQEYNLAQKKVELIDKHRIHGELTTNIIRDKKPTERLLEGQRLMSTHGLRVRTPSFEPWVLINGDEFEFPVQPKTSGPVTVKLGQPKTFIWWDSLLRWLGRRPKTIIRIEIAKPKKVERKFELRTEPRVKTKYEYKSKYVPKIRMRDESHHNNY